MAKYILGIDETGSFLLQEGTSSFVCGVQINKSELALRQAYQQLYEDFEFPAPIPSTCNELLQFSSPQGNNNKARFHFNHLTSAQVEKCKQRLLPFVENVFVSSGKPALYANNQNWWLIAIVVVIRGFLKHTQFEPGAEIEVWIDNRDKKVWGVIEEKRPEFITYHNLMKEQIEKFVKCDVPENCKLQIRFKSDTSNFFINLADIVCGLVRKEKKLLANKTTKCSCQTFTENTDPRAYINSKPLIAMVLILQELSSNVFTHTTLIPELLTKLRQEAENYCVVWEMFNDLLKFKIKERNQQSHLVELKRVVEHFRNELLKSPIVLDSSKMLDMMVVIVEYYSHIGEADMPITRQQFIEQLCKNDDKGETRILRKWEKLLSFSLREAQCHFNNYSFTPVRDTFEQLYSTQETLIKSLPNEVAGDSNRKDEPITAILGTLAQSYAYSNDLENAIDYLNLSKDYAISTSSVTASYLCCTYHRMKDWEQAKTAFEQQAGTTLEQYSIQKDFPNLWCLLNYCKLCALDVYLNGQTEYTIPLEAIMRSDQKEYPYPLVRKWAGITLFLMDPERYKSEVSQLFDRAITDLLLPENGLAIRTLALPIIQCYALVNNQNPYHTQYGRYMIEMKSQSPSFTQHVNNKAPVLNSIKNDADMWQRAMALPFIYS
ncbi:MAG: DUF3800 domain-containing protein [Bacteroidaceae bacterium]|nr:DUF3800 domain-containing protein [Bacteroidaceae bacterium]